MIRQQKLLDSLKIIMAGKQIELEKASSNQALYIKSKEIEEKKLEDMKAQLEVLKKEEAEKPDGGTGTADGTKPGDGTQPGGTKPDDGTKPGDDKTPDDGTKPTEPKADPTKEIDSKIASKKIQIDDARFLE